MFIVSREEYQHRKQRDCIHFTSRTRDTPIMEPLTPSLGQDEQSSMIWEERRGGEKREEGRDRETEGEERRSREKKQREEAERRGREKKQSPAGNEGKTRESRESSEGIEGNEEVLFSKQYCMYAVPCNSIAKVYSKRVSCSVYERVT